MNTISMTMHFKGFRSKLRAWVLGMFLFLVFTTVHAGEYNLYQNNKFGIGFNVPASWNVKTSIKPIQKIKFDKQGNVLKMDTEITNSLQNIDSSMLPEGLELTDAEGNPIPIKQTPKILPENSDAVYFSGAETTWAIQLLITEKVKRSPKEMIGEMAHNPMVQTKFNKNNIQQQKIKNRTVLSFKTQESFDWVGQKMYYAPIKIYSGTRLYEILISRLGSPIPVELIAEIKKSLVFK